MRLQPNGSPDRSFGRAGLVARRIGHRSFATAVAIEDRGAILVGGQSRNEGRSASVLLRIRRDGKLDRGFARGGIARNPVPPKQRGVSEPREILPSRGQIVVIRDGTGRQVTAYGNDGRIDSSFPEAGALDPNHRRRAPLGAIQGEKLLVLERLYDSHSSFVLRRLLLR